MIDDASAVAGGSEPAVFAKSRAPYSERPVARARWAKTRELVKRLVTEGPHPGVRSQRPKEDGGLVPVPTWLRHLQLKVTALKDDERRLGMPSALRRRSLLLLQGLAAEAVQRGYEVRKAGSSFYPREGGVGVAVDGFAYTVSHQRHQKGAQLSG
ncbi:hypothetical protein [Streptomyces misionensis]